MPVLVARDRAGQTANLIHPLTRATDMAHALRPLLPSDTILCTDGSSALAAAARSLNVEQHDINVAAGSRVRGDCHIQNVNAFDSPTQAMDASIQWLRDSLSSQLSRLVLRSRPVSRSCIESCSVSAIGCSALINHQPMRTEPFL